MTRGEGGEAYMKVEWSVYDRLRRTTVYKTTTEGYTDLKITSVEGVGILLDDVFGSAAHNLGADEEFYNLIVHGIHPYQKPGQLPTVPIDRDDPITIKKRALSTTPLPQDMETKRQVAVMIESGSGHGSGFFITEDGHILTNQHVVGNAERVRIVTANKKKKLIGTVLRRDKVRDVAVIKLDDISEENINRVTRPIRTDWPKVGEDIYAIGAPLSSRSLQDTVTKGIVSAHRKNFRIFGTVVNLIQGDVTIHGGNSGGPLLDTYGNIVGVSVAGRVDGDQLNYFIPIAEALNHLDIQMH